MHFYDPGSYSSPYYNSENESFSLQNKKGIYKMKPGQMERLLHEIELRPDLVAGRVDRHTGKQNFHRQWAEVAAIISALPGPKFTGPQIKKRWSQLKYRMKSHRDLPKSNGGGGGQEENEEEEEEQISPGTYANGEPSYHCDDGNIQRVDDVTTSKHATTSNISEPLVQVSIKGEPDFEESFDCSSPSSVHEIKNGERKVKESVENGSVSLQDIAEIQQGIFSRIEALESTLKNATNSITTAIREASDKQSEYLREQNRLLNCLLTGLCPQFRTKPS